MTDHKDFDASSLNGRVLTRNGKLHPGVYPMDEPDCLRADLLLPRIAMTQPMAMPRLSPLREQQILAARQITSSSCQEYILPQK